MSEKVVVSKTTSPNTVETLFRDFRNLSIQNDDTLIVHSSLSSLGWIAGGEQALIEALLKTVENGNLVMPAHTSHNSDPIEWENPPIPKEWFYDVYDHAPAFEVDKTPSYAMGKVAELFRTWPLVMRSNHPQVSFAAHGKDALFITENHPLTPQMGVDSPLGKLYDMNAKVLLIGVSYDVCSALHFAEIKWGGLPLINMGAAILEDGKRQWRWFDDFDYDANDFGVIGRAFEKEQNDLINHAVIGMAKCRLFYMKDIVDFGANWMKSHR